GRPARRLELAALVEAEAPRPGHGAVRGGGRLGEAVHAGERRQERRQVTPGAGANRRHLLLHLAELRRDLAEIAPVVRGAEPPRQAREQKQDRAPRDGAGLEQLAAALPAQIESGEPGLWEDDLEQGTREEVAPPGRMLRRQEPPLEAEPARQRAHDPVDGASFLGAAREVDPAQDERRIELRRRESRVDELDEAIAEKRELLREAVEQRAPRRIALLLEALRQPIVETPLEALQFGRQRGGLEPILAVAQREAPRLRALLLAECREVLAEAGEEVGLRHQHVDRNADAELLVELLHPGAQGLRVRRALRRRLLQEVADADRHQHAVDGPARARFLEQLQEALPGRGVDVAVALLGGIASRGVEEHRLFREPPVAVSRPADAANRLAAEPVGEGKAQPGVDQRGGLAGARGADEDVPRQVVEVLLRAERAQPRPQRGSLRAEPDLPQEA